LDVTKRNKKDRAYTFARQVKVKMPRKRSKYGGTRKNNRKGKKNRKYKKKRIEKSLKNLRSGIKRYLKLGIKKLKMWLKTFAREVKKLNLGPIHLLGQLQKIREKIGPIHLLGIKKYLRLG